MNEEKLIPVRAESELRVGMIVVLISPVNEGTGRRRGQRRGIITGRVPHPVLGGDGWLVEPGPFGFYAPGFIEKGRLFRVEDGMSADDDVKATKPRAVTP